MSLKMLAVDKDVVFSSQEQNEWNKHGVSTVRVESMREALEMLSKDNFLLVAINADNIDYIPMMRIMRSIIPATPVFVITSHFSIRGEKEAYQYSADGYAQRQDCSAENIASALALLQRCTERNTHSAESAQYIVLGNLFISPHFRQVFYKENEIMLTKKEFDLLLYFVDHREYVLSHEQIYSKVCRADNEQAFNVENAVCCLVNRLRRKVAAVAGKETYIETVWDIGYKFVNPLSR